MARLLRLATILGVCARHRLDTLLSDFRAPWPVRALLRITALLPAPIATRGARLRLTLEELGPIFVKFGQLLSTRPDLIPADICAELDRLQDQVPPFPSEQFVAIIETALGDSVDNLFQAFERTPLASASVAQVHAAVLKDGRNVVIKAIRPGVRSVIEQDCALLLAIAHVVESFIADGKRLHAVQVAKDYRLTILDELNLQREGANTTILRRNFATSTMLYVPEVHWRYSNEKVLVMERIYATPMADLATLRAQGTDFKVLAERGVEIFFTQVFEHNFFHADMHPGNIFVDASNPRAPRYLAVDCAIIGTLSDADQYYLARNLLAIFRRDYRQVAELHVLSGWAPDHTPINEFEAAIRTVCEPIFERPLKDISVSQLLVDLFRTARRFDTEIQPALVLLEKTLINIEGLGRQLYPDLDLWATAHPYLERWLKRRFQPGTFLDRLKRHGPEWLEQFPQVPQLLFQAMEQLKRLDKTVAAQAVAPTRRPRSAGLAATGGLCLGVAVGLAIPALLVASINGASAIAIALGIGGAILVLLS